MKTKQEKIDAIYEKIANKDLDFGWVVQSKYWKSIYLDTRPWQLYNIYRPNYKITDKEKEMEIIGHPVMIGDVIDFIEKNTQEVKPEQTKWEGVIKIQLWCSRCKAIEIFTGHIIFVWQNKRFPIEEQPDKCIDFIYSLLSK